MDTELKTLMKSFGALACLDCGKCTANCPVAPHADFSPRLTIARMMAMDREAFFAIPDIGECLTCGMCAERCPSDVKFTYLIRELRAVGAAQGWSPTCAHAGALHAMMRMQRAPEKKPSQTAWLTDDLRVAKKGKVLYFAGCLSQFDIYFNDLDLDMTGIARSMVRILNSMGIEPVVLPDESCCGHDLLWSGDKKSFEELTIKNVKAIRKAGVETVVCTCAECYHTLKFDVNELMGRLPFDVVHSSIFLKHRALSEEISLSGNGESVTYHDPCRLGRLSGVYGDPREVLAQVSELREMEHSRHAGICCGTSLWTNCNAASMAVQTRRLDEAAATGADCLVTACPKCMIHFRCAQKKNESSAVPDIPIKDLVQVVAESLE